MRGVSDCAKRHPFWAIGSGTTWFFDQSFCRPVALDSWAEDGRGIIEKKQLIWRNYLSNWLFEASSMNRIQKILDLRTLSGSHTFAGRFRFRRTFGLIVNLLRCTLWDTSYVDSRLLMNTPLQTWIVQPMGSFIKLRIKSLQGPLWCPIEWPLVSSTAVTQKKCFFPNA